MWNISQSDGVLEEEVVARGLLLGVLLRSEFVYSRSQVVRVASEGDSQLTQKPVHPLEQRFWTAHTNKDSKH